MAEKLTEKSAENSLEISSENKAQKADAREHEFRVSVRDLVDFSQRSGDLNYRFSSRSSAMEGIRGHQKIQKSRGSEYQAEKSVKDVIELPGLRLVISGRVDGVIAGGELIVEEIKTLRTDPEFLPESVRQVHWGQVRVYGCLLARSLGYSQVVLRLCYLDLNDGVETTLDEDWDSEALASFYQDLVDLYVRHLQKQIAWIETRNTSIEHCSFPYGEFRPNQRDMAVSVYRALKLESQLVLQAPTGIGKTMGSLFPAIKALRELEYEKLFFLSAKTSGQKAAEEAVTDIKNSGATIRAITLTAKDKICFTPGAPCDPEHCPYAVGYYDKLPGILASELGSQHTLDRHRIEILGREHEICPFELSLDLSLIADVVICDYNYVFDPTVYLRRYFDDVGSKIGVLIDEAHNLVDRGRDMYSAELVKEEFLEVRKQVKDFYPALARSMNRVNEGFLKLLRPLKEHLALVDELKLDESPEEVMGKLHQFVSEAEEQLQHMTGNEQTDLLGLYFDALRFLRMADGYVEVSGESRGEGYAYLLCQRGGNTVLKLYCLDPGPRLGESFAKISGSVCFSATLGPQDYFQQFLGVRENAAWYQIPSPFEPSHLAVITTSYIATTYRERQSSLYDLVDTLHEVVSARTGNYLLFFPSHHYLSDVADKFAERYPGIPLLRQQSGMDESAREDFLAAFEQTETTQVGFAVMGGVFGEGIDLKGSKLIGAVVVGVGLPQLCLERDLIKEHFATRGLGFEFAYQYPGMNRVLQTAGRVIRSETDTGIVCLIDHRFNEARYQRLFPPTWQPQVARSQQHLGQLLRAFWENQT